MIAANTPMAILRVLGHLDLVVTITATIVIIYLVFPAYKRTKNKGFLFLGAGAFGSLFNTFIYHTLGNSPLHNPAGYHFAQYSYRSLFVVDGVLELIGMVIIIKSYLRLFESREKPEI